MGTYLCAYVEVRSPEYGCWNVVAEWDLSKSYELMSALDVVGSDGWPDDSLLLRDEAKSDCYAKRTTTPDELRAITIAPEWPAWSRAFFASLLASLAPLETLYPGVRVLWGRD